MDKLERLLNLTAALLDAAWAQADTVIPGSCFCRTKTAEQTG